MTAAAGVPAGFVAGMRQMPMWQGMEAIAHTIAYDGMLVEHFSATDDRLRSLDVPALVLDAGRCRTRRPAPTRWRRPFPRRAGRRSTASRTTWPTRRWPRPSPRSSPDDMRDLVVIAYVSMDGVVQAPGHRIEDPAPVPDDAPDGARGRAVADDRPAGGRDLRGRGVAQRRLVHGQLRAVLRPTAERVPRRAPAGPGRGADPVVRAAALHAA
jgi:hypothetical protein